MRTLLQDLRYGARMVRRQPTFSLVVVLTLALAIGANTVIFSFANILLLRPLPMKDSDTLGWIFAVDPHRGGNRGPLSIPEFIDYRHALTSFDVAGGASIAIQRDADRARRRPAPDRVACLGQPDRRVGPAPAAWAARSRTDADRRARPAKSCISHHYWDREFDRDPSIVGQTLMLDGRPATVVGVLAPDIEIGNLSEIDVWVPLVARRRMRRAKIARCASTAG